MENVFSNSVIHAGLYFSQVLNIDMLVQPFSCTREHMFVNIFPFLGAPRSGKTTLFANSQTALYRRENALT